MATATKDAVLGSAVDLARAAAQEVAEHDGLVGEHLGVVVEGERLVSHRFATTSPGYRGWQWVVTLARVPRGRTASICEVDLLPGDGAILAPPWVPWAERLQPGDVGPGDVLPYLDEDERLEQGYEATGDVDADQMALFELGLGRERVLSREGRSQAAQRWYAGTHGPTAPVAVAASAPCSTCAFLVLMAGSLRTEFGVCANEWSPDDGTVVSMDHGCGAHSQTDVATLPSEWPDPAPFLDEGDVELVTLTDEAETAESGTADETPASDVAPASDETDADEAPASDETDADEAPVSDEAPTSDEAPAADETVPGEE
ncbi:DUF3027 domain-containing protein [Actinotalea sp. K2]|uniref:DUF3027 domain-containing protein n=1 Tax=Actinotalea sp. K2 TaxID=2939438 RepID=UPI00201734B0|nr:DUF3027 domain-containing protein [Actinotalea sp. K2]MCL3861532.1 DUF3027 domain-containing protein [Actinotalea sp. K2]